ncbi:MAG: tRNA threonylcarbamoyladenosine dehydratase [Bacteroidota bacterium]
MNEIPVWQSRTELLIKEENVEKLHNAHVLVAGLGGVGGMAAEMLCRAGVGNMTILDGDKVQSSNRNRQLLALSSTENKEKTQVMADRLLDINPKLNLHIVSKFTSNQTTIDLLNHPYDYVLDAIDTLSPKIYLLFHAVQMKHKVVSSMGAGGKFDPLQLQVCDISETHTCTLAFDIRKRLRKLGVSNGIKAVFSPEVVPVDSRVLVDGERNKKSMVGTISYMPAVFGCVCASVVIRDLIEVPNSKFQYPNFKREKQ